MSAAELQPFAAPSPTPGYQHCMPLVGHAWPSWLGRNVAGQSAEFFAASASACGSSQLGGGGAAAEEPLAESDDFAGAGVRSSSWVLGAGVAVAPPHAMTKASESEASRVTIESISFSPRPALRMATVVPPRMCANPRRNTGRAAIAPSGPAHGGTLFFVAVLLVGCRSQPPIAEPVATVTIPPTPEASAPEAPPDAPDGGCAIELGAKLAANIYRGVRDTPAQRATRDHLDPKTRAEWDAHDHGVTYLLCKYAVRMNGRSYTYEHVAGHNVTQRAPLDLAQCDAAATRAAVTKAIHESTHECSDPHAGAYWGFDLVPEAQGE
jgi:hypothetical protein